MGGAIRYAAPASQRAGYCRSQLKIRPVTDKSNTILNNHESREQLTLAESAAAATWGGARGVDGAGAGELAVWERERARRTASVNESGREVDENHL